MNLIFYGLCFLLLTLSMNGLDLLPDFVGYFLLYRGLGQLALKSQRLTKLQGSCIAMSALTLLIWPVSFSPEAGLVFGITFAMAKVFLLYWLIGILQELQASFPDAFFDIETLRVRWTLVLTVEAVSYAAVLLGMNALVTGLLWFASTIISVLFLMAFHRTRQVYNSVTS